MLLPRVGWIKTWDQGPAEGMLERRAVNNNNPRSWVPVRPLPPRPKTRLGSRLGTILGSILHKCLLASEVSSWGRLSTQNHPRFPPKGNLFTILGSRLGPGLQIVTTQEFPA